MYTDNNNSGPRCETCRYAVQSSGVGYIWCRRYPPTIFADDGNVRQVDPRLPKAHWCGEWKPGPKT